MASPIHSAIVGRRRTCPKCGHRQLVAILLIHESVTCRRCGARIPPSSNASSGAAPGASARKPRP